jgi:DNA repair protein RecN (Recombination protein N)
MLLELQISNFAIIEECHVAFHDGLVALTGETGAGKSIIVDALSAVLGSRTGSDAVRTGCDKAVIEAVFDGKNLTSAARDALREHGIEDDDVLILRREIHAAGRSLGRVNGQTVPMSLLGEVGARVVDMHGQSEHLSLLRRDRQLDMLDHFGNLDQQREAFSAQAREVTTSRERLEELRLGQRGAAQRIDLLRFQIEEIDQAVLQDGEDEQLTAERSRLANAEKLAALTEAAIAGLEGSDDQPGASEQLAEISRNLSEMARIDGSLEASEQTANDLRFQLEDLVRSVRQYRDKIEFDPVRLDDVESRLTEIGRLKRKYGDTIEDVLAFASKAREDLDSIENYDLRVSDLEADLKLSEEKAGRAAGELTAKRKQATGMFAGEVLRRLERLGLAGSRFEVGLRHSVTEDGIPADVDGEVQRLAFSSSGVDQVEFRVSFNAGEELRPIERVASGGETARFMLAVKATLAANDDIGTLIFDEIDTGVGGRSGQIVGAMLRELGDSHQVIAITHLPQVAAQAEQHIKVLKSQHADRTGVDVVDLDREARVEEIAEMLAGPAKSETAIRSAEELLAAVAGT